MRKGETATADGDGRRCSRARSSTIPSFTWVLRGDARRMKVLRRGFELFLRRVWLAEQHVYTTAGTAGVAVWEPPGAWKHERRRCSCACCRRSLGGLRPALPARAALAGRARSRAPGRAASTPPHYYLAFLGVDPAVAGPRARRGAAGARCSRAATQSACPPSWRPPRRATARCTNATGSRSPASSRSGAARRRSGACGASRAEPRTLSKPRARVDNRNYDALPSAAIRGLQWGHYAVTVRAVHGEGQLTGSNVVLVRGCPWRGRNAQWPDGLRALVDEWRPHDWKDS